MSHLQHNDFAINVVLVANRCRRGLVFEVALIGQNNRARIMGVLLMVVVKRFGIGEEGLRVEGGINKWGKSV